jgi:UDP-N-acetylmuramoyl-L-alanyl-D-glutamate--2,6-diaminopimelate ligase
MKLGRLLAGVPAAASDVNITRLSASVRSVRPGSLYFCLTGPSGDDHEKAPAAVAAGAVALVVERPLGVGVPEVLVPDVQAAMAAAAIAFHCDPAASLEVVGVTGTNGKTTTSYLIRAMLEAGGLQTGLLGTVGAVIGGVQQRVRFTTPPAVMLHSQLRAMVSGGDVACVLEVSSHALNRRRTDGIAFAAAIFTNLTPEHAELHPTLEDYFQTKRRLFVDGAPRAAIVNLDDRFGARLAAELPAVRTFALDREADYRATDYLSEPDGGVFTAHTPNGAVEVRMLLRGRFNVYNVLGALAVADALGVELEPAVAALRTAGRVRGRLEPVDEGQDFTVLVDYAHTPAALDAALCAAHELARAGAGQLHVVFGCGGGRDCGQRPVMGEIASRLADRVTVTSDNPRDEDPAAIIESILVGAGPQASHRVDRAEAIAEALSVAAIGDVVVIAGKGHECFQDFGRAGRVRFDDVAVARVALRARLGEPVGASS